MTWYGSVCHWDLTLVDTGSLWCASRLRMFEHNAGAKVAWNKCYCYMLKLKATYIQRLV